MIDVNASQHDRDVIYHLSYYYLEWSGAVFRIFAPFL